MTQIKRSAPHPGPRRGGLHLIDVDHSMGTLIDIVRDQAAAYGARPEEP